jgi:hypothetical protein
MSCEASCTGMNTAVHTVCSCSRFPDRIDLKEKKYSLVCYVHMDMHTYVYCMYMAYVCMYYVCYVCMLCMYDTVYIHVYMPLYIYVHMCSMYVMYDSYVTYIIFSQSSFNTFDFL